MTRRWRGHRLLMSANRVATLGAFPAVGFCVFHGFTNPRHPAGRDRGYQNRRGFPFCHPDPALREKGLGSFLP